MKKRTSKEIFAQTLLELSRRTPIDKITVTQLVEESGLSSKTFYNHFQNKSELMVYIEESEAHRLHEKLKKNNYSFHDYLKDGVIYYRKIQHFIRNAIYHTSGHEDFGKLHAEASYKAILIFLLKLNNLDELNTELKFALRLYVYGLVEMYARHVLADSVMPDEKFVELCEEAMPERLKPFLLKDESSLYQTTEKREYV